MRIQRLFLARALLTSAILAAAACKSETGPLPSTPSTTGTTAIPSGTATADTRSTRNVDDALPFLAPPATPFGHRLASPLHLYSWTTAEQAEQIRQSQTLLLRTESPEHGGSYYDQVMHQAADAGDRVAALLRTMTFQKARFAWTSAWATRMGWPGENYGDVLLDIVVRDGALIAKRNPDDGTWSVVSTDGAPATVAELLAHPERLGAVVFESRGKDGAPAYREIVLCNEAQIESFSFGTEAVLTEIDREIGGLELASKALRDFPEAGGPATRAQTIAAWNDPVGGASTDPPARLRRAYLSNVAFDNDAYVFDPAKVDAIAASLRGARMVQPGASSFTSSGKYAGPGTPAPPPTAKPKTYGAPYYGTYIPPRRPKGHP